MESHTKLESQSRHIKVYNIFKESQRQAYSRATFLVTFLQTNYLASFF